MSELPYLLLFYGIHHRNFTTSIKLYEGLSFKGNSGDMLGGGWQENLEHGMK